MRSRGENLCHIELQLDLRIARILCKGLRIFGYCDVPVLLFQGFFGLTKTVLLTAGNRKCKNENQQESNFARMHKPLIVPLRGKKPSRTTDERVRSTGC